MELLHPRCAGLDVSKKDAKVAVRVVGEGGVASTAVTTWSSMTGQVLALREHLLGERVTCVVMEATGQYWKPFYYVLEGGPWELLLVNAHHVRALRGRKSDVADSAHLADLAAHGMVTGSFVPPAPIRALRDLTRTRTLLGRDRAREVQRLAGFLEDAGIKLGVVATDILGVSGRAMLEALVAGERDPRVLADLAHRSLRRKTDDLIEALQGNFAEHHAFMVRVHLDLIDHLSEQIDLLTTRIEEAMAPFRDRRDLLTTLPGVSVRVADVVIAETGGDMTVFPSGHHLASWAGTVPGSNSSADKAKPAPVRPGNPFLKGALGTAAMAVAKSRTTFFGAKHRRIAARRGPIVAVVAVEHAMLVAIWHMLTTSTPYRDPGPDYHARHNPSRVRDRAIATLTTIGYDVTLTPKVT